MRISDWSSDVCSSDLRHSPDPDSGQKPDSYDEAHYRALFRDAPYYSTGRNWCDYAPAYRYGHVARDEHPHERFEQVEPELAREWRRRQADSRLPWTEAPWAVRDGWRQHHAVQSEQRSVGKRLHRPCNSPGSHKP